MEPIVATILLVLISVVLGAVLYVLVSGLARGPTSAPLGSALALGPAAMETGTASTAAYCASGHTCYSVSVASGNTALTVAEVDFALLNQSGATQLAQVGSGLISVVAANGNVVATSTPIPTGNPLIVTTWSYQNAYNGGTPVTSGVSIWVQFGNFIPNPTAGGFVLEAIGMGSFQGTVQYSLP